MLAGIIGSLLAQGFSAEKAAAVGVYWHGAAGDLAASNRVSIGSLVAGDIVEAL
ncbi:carbohydrate kinase [Cohnella sp. SGD-V74]|nr:carbohydrate kinase [Cohnella sp. SGD-V74]